MSMNETQRDWLRRNHRTLLENIAPKDVGDILFEQDCLSRDDLERINSAATNEDKVRIILENLPRRNRNGLKALQDALQETSPWVLTQTDPIPILDQTDRPKPITKVDTSVFIRLVKRAEVLDNWNHLARCLQLSDADISVIGNAQRHDPRERAYQVLSKWKSKNGRQATPELLISALREIDLNALADELEGI